MSPWLCSIPQVSCLFLLVSILSLPYGDLLILYYPFFVLSSLLCLDVSNSSGTKLVECLHRGNVQALRKLFGHQSPGEGIQSDLLVELSYLGSLSFKSTDEIFERLGIPFVEA